MERGSVEALSLKRKKNKLLAGGRKKFHQGSPAAHVSSARVISPIFASFSSGVSPPTSSRCSAPIFAAADGAVAAAAAGYAIAIAPLP